MTATARTHPSRGTAAGAAMNYGGGEDVRRFWSAYAVSALGSGVGALPLVAIIMLRASDWQVSLLAVLGGLAGVAVTVPLGPWIEFHHKRPCPGFLHGGRFDGHLARAQRYPRGLRQ